MNYKLLGQILQDARCKIGLKQSDVASKLNCTAANISSWERGKSKVDIDSFFSLCQLYNIDFAKTLDTVANEKTNITILNNDNYSQHEKKIIAAYRAKPEMQAAIDKLLEIDNNEETFQVLTAARSSNNKPVGYETMTKEELERLSNAKSVEDEVDL